MSRQNWDDEYESPLFIFPDDEDDGYEAMPIVFDDDEGAPAPQPEPEINPEGGISVVPSAAPADDGWSSHKTSSLTRRNSASKAPVEYPEGSLGAFSTPEDYEAHMSAAQDTGDDGDQEYDNPIFLFPPDEVEETPEPTRNRLSSSTDDGDLDDSIGISFSRYSAESKEGEFFFMPFLDIPDEIEDEDVDDEDEGEEISFSFRKVDAEQVKKEKEFIFMPFLNISEEASDDEEEEEEPAHRRSSKGTIFDEGLYLIPLESEEEEEPEEEKKPEDPEEDDSGIYFVSTVGGVVPEAPKLQRTEKKTTLKSEAPAPSERKKKKKSTGKSGSPSGKKPPAKSGSKTGKSTVGKNASAEEQFRAAMRNVSPEIRAAVKNDPVQRAALEQAVRIALVQQAAQEAVEKATGRPVFGGSSSAVSSRKKKRIPRPPQSQSQKPVSSFLGGSSRASTMSFSPITLRTPYDDGGVSEFGVTDEPKTTTETSTSSNSSAGTLISAGTAGVPDTNQDSILALLNASGQGAGAAQNAAPDSAQDSVLDTLAGKNGSKPRSAYQSPAAVRAAMRTGLDFEAPQPQAAAAVAPKTAVSAAEQEMQAKRSGCLIWIIVAFVAFIVGLIAILILPNINKQNSFDKAVDLMNSGRYTQAIALFEEFDSSDTKFYDQCRTNISECAYKQASQYYAEGKYYEAYNLLMDKAIVNDDTTALALRCNYYYAEQRYAEGDWQTAAAAYANLLDEQYEDSQDKYNICQYQVASQDAEAGDYLQAYQGFGLLGDYSDSRYRAACMVCKAWDKYYQSVTDVQLADAVAVLKEHASNGEALDLLNTVYVGANEFRDNQQHTNAYKTFQALGDYSDSGYLEALSLYEIWSTNPDYGTLTQREDAMDELRVRVGNDEAVQALNSSGFNPVRLMGQWTDGESTMSLQRTDPGSDELSLVLELVSHDGTIISIESSHIGFDGNVLYWLTNPEDSASAEVIFEVTGFDSLVAKEPQTFTLYCFLNNSEYALERD